MVADSLEVLVDELDRLLTVERAALCRMDPVQIEALTVEKGALLERLTTVSREGANRETISSLARLRDVALENQLLLVHARDLARGVVERLAPGRGARGALLEVRG